MIRNEFYVLEDLDVFIHTTLMSLQAKSKENFSLGFGQGGDLLFSFYASHVLDNSKVSCRTLKTMANDMFKKILLLDSNMTMSYWRGSVGLVQLFEVIDQNGLAEMDLNKVLLEFDTRLLKHLMFIDNPSDEDLLMINTLLSRLRHYKETDSIYQKTLFLCVKYIESIFRFFDTTEIDIYNNDINMKIDFLCKMLHIGLYIPPIETLATQVKQLAKVQLNSSLVTFDFVNNVLSIREYLKSIGDKIVISSLSEKLCSINYFNLQLEKHLLNGITPAYLSFINKLIYLNKYFALPSVDIFINRRLTSDIKSALDRKLPKDIDRGIIGVSGIALTLISYRDYNAPNWHNIFMIS